MQVENIKKPSKTLRIGYLLVEEFSMMCITSMINPFRSANRELGYKAIEWDFLTTDDQVSLASDGFEAKPSLPIDTAQPFDYFFICAGLETDPSNRSKLNAAMQRLSKQSNVFGALCTGSFLLARAGFLKDRNFTLHWEDQSYFVEEFPDLTPSTALYVIDEKLWTGSGGLSSMDIALKIISDEYGGHVANAVGNQYQIDRIREPNIEQRPFFLSDYQGLPPKMQTCMKIMLGNMEHPIAIPDIAKMIGITVRSLERAFQENMQTSPAKYYRKLRLEKAKYLIWHTNMSVLEISILAGFPSPSYLSKLYRQEFGVFPSKERKKR